MSTTLRIHPAIGISRCGNAKSDYIISPETSAGMPAGGGAPDPEAICGGLPIRRGTEDTPISNQEVRDDAHALNPHAQRFRIFAYDETPDGTYPYTGTVREITVGCTLDGKTVTGITWQVHMANKKSNNWIIPENPLPEDLPQDDNGIGGMAHYAGDFSPSIRNADFGTSAYPVPPLNSDAPPDSGQSKSGTTATLGSAVRRKHLVLDAGPKTIATGADPVQFDAGPCSYIDDTGAVQSVDYPTQFPSDVFDDLYMPNGSPLGTLGRMETDAKGRLYVVGSPGFAAGWRVKDNNPGGTVDAPASADLPPLSDPFPLQSDIDNDGWFDDAGDGPVTAALTFDDGSARVIEVPAWCLCADPSYAPQVRNVVTIWDEVYNTWLRSDALRLDPQIYDAKAFAGNDSAPGYNPKVQPPFYEDVWSMFRAAHLQMFSTDLNAKGIGHHQRVNNISPSDDPAKYLNVKSFIRNPNTAAPNDLQTGAPLMPLALGDTGASFLTVTHTQYFFLEQWFDGLASADPQPLTAGETLDKVTLTNLLGGRFSPGIDLTFVVRDPSLYRQDWTAPDVGPFRIGGRMIDYGNLPEDGPVLTVGYIPNSGQKNAVEPGDLCKFMALPWHTDYNSCATHQPAPNPERNTTLFWSWPAQRPVSVYTYADYQQNENRFVAQQRFSVRGTGTQWTAGNPDHEMDNGPSSVGRYQERIDMLSHWFDIGTVIQGQAIQDFVTDPDHPELFLEVESRLTGPSDWSQPWPIQITDKVYTEEQAGETEEAEE